MNSPQKLQTEISNNMRFLRSWFQRPLVTGAVSPSGKALAHKMASYVNGDSTAPVLEIGPGTGPVTKALIKHGVAEERLVLLEYSLEFCELLRQRFPKAMIIQGDAYTLKQTVGAMMQQKASAIVSSLPLLTKPQDQRLSLLKEAFDLSEEGAPFIQFTYSAASPIPLNSSSSTVSFSAESSSRIWMNIPPAKVWVYKKQTAL